MKKCSKYSGCGFIKKHRNNPNYKHMINEYCKGNKQEDCKRMMYKKKTGNSPSDDMLPNGQMIKA